jgi:hypothetical protein
MSWKRVLDPSGNPKGFGFAVFEDAEGVLMALYLLGGINMRIKNAQVTPGLEIPSEDSKYPTKALKVGAKTFLR